MCVHAHLMSFVGRGQAMGRGSVLKQCTVSVEADKYLQNKLCVKVEFAVGLLYILLFLFIPL